MFQKETAFRMKFRLMTAILGLSLPLWGAQPTTVTREAFLAEISIDDLISKDRSKEKKEGEKASEKSTEQLEDTLSKKSAEFVFELDETLVLEEVKYQIAKHFELQDDFRLFFDQAWETLKLKHPDWQLKMTQFPSQGLRSQFYVSFEIWTDGKRHTTWQRGVRCELWKDAYVAVQRIDRGSLLNESLVTIRPVDTLSLYQTPVDIGTELTDFVLANGVKAGAPVFWRDLRERPLVQKNSIVEVIAEEGLMKITLKGKALEDGVKGQLIRVRNLQSYSDIQAEVVGVNQARVYF